MVRIVLEGEGDLVRLWGARGGGEGGGAWLVVVLGSSMGVGASTVKLGIALRKVTA